MKADVTTDSFGNITVLMKGGLNYENTGNLQQELIDLIKTNPTSLITIDMDGVDFVGSSGIGTFVEIVRTLNTQTGRQRVSLSNVKSEFRKVFKLYTMEESWIEVDDFGMDDNETASISHFYNHKNRTFEN